MVNLILKVNYEEVVRKVVSIKYLQRVKSFEELVEWKEYDLYNLYLYFVVYQINCLDNKLVKEGERSY